MYSITDCLCVFFFQAEDGIRDGRVTGVQTCALPISPPVRSIAPVAPTPHQAPVAEVAAVAIKPAPVNGAEPASEEPELELPPHEEEERPELPPHESSP